MKIRFKKASSEDIPGILNLVQQVWPATFRSILTQQQIEYMLNMMYSRDSLLQQMVEFNHVFYIVYDLHNNEIGYVSYQLDYKELRVSKIHKLYVLPQYQGHGYGKQIFSTLFDEMRMKNQCKVVLNVNRNNIAIEFYKKHEFTIYGKEDIDIGNGFLMEDYIMIKSLTSTN